MIITSRIRETVFIAMKDGAKKFLSGFTDFMTSGGLAGMAGRKVGDVLDPTGKGAGERLKSLGKIGTMGAFGAAGKLGSFAANAMDLNKTNGMTDDMGLPSQGAQELAQKVQQNEMSGLQQRTANFMQNINPYQELMRDTTVEDPNTGKRINKDLLDLLNNRPDLRKRMDETGSIFSEM